MFGQPSVQNPDFECDAFTEAISRLIYVTEQKEPFVLLTGGAGTGRTTLLQRLSSCLTESTVLHSLNGAGMTESGMLRQICQALSISLPIEADRCHLMLAACDELAGRGMCRQHTVVIIDDMDQAIDDLTSIVQFLGAVNSRTGGAVTLMAAAQSGNLAEIEQSSALRVNLQPLTPEDSARFIAEHFITSRIDLERVTDEAWNQMVVFGEGMPGRLSRLCEIATVALTGEPDLTLNAETIHLLVGETLLRRAG